MEDRYLTTGEFERWTREDRDFKREMRQSMKTLTEKDSKHGERLTALETDMLNVKPMSRSTSIKWGAGITGVLTLVIQALIAAFGGK